MVACRVFLCSKLTPNILFLCSHRTTTVALIIDAVHADIMLVVIIILYSAGCGYSIFSINNDTYPFETWNNETAHESVNEEDIVR